MRKIAGVLVAGLLLLPVPGAGGAEFKSCPEEFQRISDLKAVQVTCNKARWVAHKFDQKVMEAGEWPSGPVWVGRYRCRNKPTGSETYRIHCARKSGAIVKFEWGV
jgi:hypothetical protein